MLVFVMVWVVMCILWMGVLSFGSSFLWGRLSLKCLICFLCVWWSCVMLLILFVVKGRFVILVFGVNVRRVLVVLLVVCCVLIFCNMVSDGVWVIV